MILLARHGETDDNVPPARVQGWRDVPLNERGREQARALAAAAAAEEPRALWTSSMSRARETAAIVGTELGLEARPDERLAESNRGDWEGRLVDDIRRDDPELWAAWRRAGEDFRFPGGESLAEHLRRVSAALDEIAAGELPALVVCHGGTIRCAFARTHPRGLDAFHELDVPNAELMRLP
ncbi:MAG: histidine phosphatase family protein [Thermoleophilaceae bacterium]